MATLLRFNDPERGARVGVQIANTIYDVSDKFPTVAAWLRASVGRPQAAIEDIDILARNAKHAYLSSVVDAPPIPNLATLIAPVDAQDVWATGVTYERARDARMEETKAGADLYERIHVAQRPELFFKSPAKRVVAPYGRVGVLKDSHSTVPEPELALLINPAMEVVGYGIGIDMTARDVEADNPLYLPQAKFYNGSCALGPGFVLGKLRTFPKVTIRMSIMRGPEFIFEGEASTDQIKRDLPNLIDYLGRLGVFEEGVVLLTGNGIIPPPDFHLRVGDVIRISMDNVGTLTTTAMVV
jgi:2-dehydro-3-deoxy-D-arabinonate dehydratase